MTEQTISVTDRAARRIGEIVTNEPEGTMLRVAVDGGGCSGFQYRFELVRERESDDLVINQADSIVLVDPISQMYMAGAQIDFVDDLIGAAFKINNPNATAACGCGTSFSI